MYLQILIQMFVFTYVNEGVYTYINIDVFR